MPAKQCKYHAPDAFGSKTCVLRHPGTPGGNTANGDGKPSGCRIVGKVGSILIGIYNYSWFQGGWIRDWNVYGWFYCDSTIKHERELCPQTLRKDSASCSMKGLSWQLVRLGIHPATTRESDANKNRGLKKSGKKPWVIIIIPIQWSINYIRAILYTLGISHVKTHHGRSPTMHLQNARGVDHHSQRSMAILDSSISGDGAKKKNGVPHFYLGAMCGSFCTRLLKHILQYFTYMHAACNLNLVSQTWLASQVFWCLQHSPWVAKLSSSSRTSDLASEWLILLMELCFTIYVRSTHCQF